MVATTNIASAAPNNNLPPGLQPTQLNITNDSSQRYGEPEVAVNPTNPNNIVYNVMSNRTTYACEAAGTPDCAPAGFLLGEPIGFWTVPGWYSSKLFVSFDRGKSWQQVSFPAIPAFRGFPGEGTDHSDLLTHADPMLTVTADGTFYIGWDAQHTCLPGTDRCLGVVDGGIAVSKSTDGGRTWSTPVLTGTGVDRPWMTTDLSTGTVFEASAGPIDSSISTGNPNLPTLPPGQPSDRWVVSSPGGVNWTNWTTPERLGGGDFSAGDATISAAQGELAAAFGQSGSAACQFFVGTPASSCTVFETSTDSGAAWSRHAVPAPGGPGIDSTLVAADPTQAGTFTVAVLNTTGTAFQVFVTHDNGATWTGPTIVTDDSTTMKFKPWINYSPNGVVGLMWRSNTQPGSSPTLPYQIFAVISADQGATWSAPLQISTAPSPGSDPAWASFGDRDDTSVIALSGQDAFIGWGDWRPGDVQGFYSAVKLQAFNHG